MSGEFGSEVGRMLGVVAADLGHTCITYFPGLGRELLVDIPAHDLKAAGVTTLQDGLFAADVNLRPESVAVILPDNIGPIVWEG